MSMDQDDYKMIAQIVSSLWWERDDPVFEGRRNIAEDFANTFVRHSTTFDKKKFLKQCGVER